MNTPVLTTHVSVSFWDGVQKTQQSTTNAAEHHLSDDCTFQTRSYCKRDTHTISLAAAARVVVKNESSINIVIALLGVTIPANDFFYAMLPAGSYELQLNVNDDHKFAVTTITE